MNQNLTQKWTEKCSEFYHPFPRPGLPSEPRPGRILLTEYFVKINYYYRKIVTLLARRARAEPGPSRARAEPSRNTFISIFTMNLVCVRRSCHYLRRFYTPVFIIAMPVRNFRPPFANHSIFARHFTPPGPSTTPRRPRRRVVKVSDKWRLKSSRLCA